jgi:hypothetical protein
MYWATLFLPLLGHHQADIRTLKVIIIIIIIMFKKRGLGVLPVP